MEAACFGAAITVAESAACDECDARGSGQSESRALQLLHLYIWKLTYMFYKSLDPRRWYIQALAAWCFVWVALPIQWLRTPSVLANPGGGTVVGGSATISTGPGQVTVQQSSHRAVVNWQGFSIEKGQTTTFVQPSARSAILNRVTGGSASRIDGNLNANGQVYLVNRNGVVVGKTGRIHTAGFTASAHDVSNAEFMKGGDLNFSGNSSASVINHGKIKATDGDVTLIARRVENHGRMTARKGSVHLAGGTEVLVKPSGSHGQRVFIKSTSGNGSVLNAGSIRAAAAELRAAGGNEYALAVNNTGVIRATAVDRSGGRIVLKAEKTAAGSSGRVENSGMLIARAGTKAPGKGGGRVDMTGDRVVLKSGSVVDVRGGTAGKGGVVNVGGGFQGKDASVSNASVTVVEKSSAILADGGAKGGNVVVWSDDATGFYGDVSARGSGQEGTGGAVEVSSKGYLDFRGTVDTNGGTLLLDPATLEIITGGGSNPLASTLDPVALANLLNLNNITLQADKWIRVTNAINSSGNADSDVVAKNNLIFNTPVLYLNAPIRLKAGAAISGTSPLRNVYVGVGGRIQNGVDAIFSSPGSLVYVAPGNFVESVSIVNKTLTVRGSGDTPGAAGTTTVNGGGVARVFLVNAAGQTVKLENLFITNGNSGGIGGGLYISSASSIVTVINSTFTANRASGGGAIFNFGNLTITESIFDNNHAFDLALGGGGIQNRGNLHLMSSTVSGNTTPGVGAGLVTVGGGILKITGSTISGNSSSDWGGGIFNNGSSLTILNSTISGNKGRRGAGLFTTAASAFTIVNSTFSSNIAEQIGGGIVASFNNGTISNSTFTRNNAGANGGGIYNLGSNITLTSSIIAGNSAQGFGPNVANLIIDGGNNLVGDTTGSAGFTTSTLLNVPEADIRLMPLGDYGGPTYTHALLPGSVALSAGSNPLGLTQDQRGRARAAGTQTDIGAFELQNFTYVYTPISGSGQSTELLSAFGQPLIVTLTTPVESWVAAQAVNLGLTVTLSVPVSGASATGTLMQDFDATGKATFYLTANRAVGTYHVGIANSGQTDAFTLTNSPISLTISPSAGQSKTYGLADPLFLYTITQGKLLDGDDLFGMLARVPGEDPGMYSFLLGTLGNPSYKLSFDSSLSLVQFTITELPSVADPSSPWRYIAPKTSAGHTGRIFYATPPAIPVNGSSSYKEFQGGNKESPETPYSHERSR